MHTYVSNMRLRCVVILFRYTAIYCIEVTNYNILLLIVKNIQLNLTFLSH